MKNKIALLALVSLCSATVAAFAADLNGTITASGAFAIYPTVVAWGDAFHKKHPQVRFDISAGGAGKGAADAIAGLVDIGMVSRDPDPSEISKGIYPIYCLHDAVFPVVSDKNPALRALLRKGVKKRTFISMYVTGKVTNWDEVAGTDIDKPVHLYTRSDSCGASASWAKYLGDKKQEDLKGVGVYGDPGLLETAKRDPLGISYNNFSYVFDKNGKVVAGARLVPIDSNENGVADMDEIFIDREDAIRAIENGRYPVTRKNYLFVKGKPTGLVKEFMKFILSDEGTAVVNQVQASLPVTKAERVRILKDLD
ncbi:MAG TPA: substrate-binding domain-containing protein [Candidatus Omnitrophota bacterium]|nr:substrate-binding domain-containing protein [Candidatus Omnitrophota bacterium]